MNRQQSGNGALWLDLVLCRHHHTLHGLGDNCTTASPLRTADLNMAHRRSRAIRPKRCYPRLTPAGALVEELACSFPAAGSSAFTAARSSCANNASKRARHPMLCTFACPKHVEQPLVSTCFIWRSSMMHTSRTAIASIGASRQTRPVTWTPTASFPGGARSTCIA